MLFIYLLMALVPYSIPHADILWAAESNRNVTIGDRTYTFEKGEARRYLSLNIN